MTGPIDGERFIALLAERFPAVADELDDYELTRPHLAMGALATVVQAAISAEDAAAVAEHFDFIGDVYRNADAAVKNAVHVSYLERLSFDGRHGRAIGARGLLSPQLWRALRGLEQYLKDNFGRKTFG